MTHFVWIVKFDGSLIVQVRERGKGEGHGTAWTQRRELRLLGSLTTHLVSLSLSLASFLKLWSMKVWILWSSWLRLPIFGGFFWLVGLNAGSGSKWLVFDRKFEICQHKFDVFLLFTEWFMYGNWTKFDKLCLYYVCLASFLQKRKSQSGSFDSWILSYWCLCGKFSSKKEKCLCGKWVQFFSCLGINF